MSTPYPHVHTLPTRPHLTHTSTPYPYIHTLPIHPHLTHTSTPYHMSTPYHTPYFTKLLTKHTLHHTICPISPYILITLYTYHLYLSPLPCHTLPVTITCEGHGFEIAQGHLGPGRIHSCMTVIGMAERTLQMMRWRSTQRETFGKPLYRHVRVHPVLHYSYH